MTVLDDPIIGVGEETRPAKPPKPPKQTRPPKPPRAARVPRPPRRAPRPTFVPAPLTTGQLLLRGCLALLAALLLGFVLNLTVLSQVQHLAAQQKLENSFRQQLVDGTAPVSEGTVDNVLLSDGDPVAVLEIPAIGLREVIVEGTAAGTLTNGPGHRRDTVLPGQAGVSVIMGRAGAYGGPFARLQELAPGEVFTVITGQGEQIYSVIGVRYAGDPTPPALQAGQGRLILETARGPAFIPTGVARVDAQLTSTVHPAGLRQSSFAALPPSAKELATDTSTVWALAFALQFFVVVELAAVWAYRRIGAQKTWIVGVPLLLLGGLFVADQVTRLLPNLL